MKIDVVVPTKGEWTLPYCVKSLRKYVQIDRLILVTPRAYEESMHKLADVLVTFDEKNVGKARAKGLEHVETKYYASVDGDVIISPHWYDWCIKTIQQRDVGACQGYAKPLAKNYSSLQEAFIRRGGMFNKGFCCLGNTMLKTDLVRKLGIPELRVGEDWALRLKMEKCGYKWISNMNLVCTHLKTDVDVWKHAIWWGKMGGEVDLLNSLHQLGYHATKGLLKHKISENLFGIALEIFMIYGRLNKYRSEKTTDKN